MKGKSLLNIAVFSLLFLFFITPTQEATPSEEFEDIEALRMFFGDEKLLVEAPTRSPKFISKVAEDITVITADEIKLINAHTLADVLAIVNGVHIFNTGGPGNLASVYIHGADRKHVTFVIDGIVLNNLSDNVFDAGSLPAQHIERIEIIKGPASSAWGSALGGIVNIITKSGMSSRTLKGSVYASYGERGVVDFRAEALGRKENNGYYFYAGRLSSEGFRVHNKLSLNSLYMKLSRYFSADTDLVFSVGYEGSRRQLLQRRDIGLNLDSEFENLRYSLSFNTELSNNVKFLVSLRALRRMAQQYNSSISSGTVVTRDKYDDRGYGSSINLIYTDEINIINFGIDYDNKTLKSNKISDGKQDLQKWAFFLNDTITLGKLTLTPGFRYDDTDINGSFFSPSLGATYSLAKSLLLRAGVARGFSTTPLTAVFGDNAFFKGNPTLKPEQGWSYQIGVESTAFSNVWLKVTGFRYEIKDVITSETLSSTSFRVVNKDKQIRQGLELDMKTTPFSDFSLNAGVIYIDAENPVTNEKIQNIPKYSFNVSIQYDHQNDLRAFLTGWYTWWNASPLLNGKYSSMIFDLNIVKTILKSNSHNLEAFFTGHNLLSGAHYLTNIYNNPRRWLEAGVRYNF